MKIEIKTIVGGTYETRSDVCKVHGKVSYHWSTVDVDLIGTITIQ